MIIPEGFTKAEPQIPCFDIWPANTFSRFKKAAYVYEEKQGNIAILKILKHRKSGFITVSYLSNCPHEWILIQLAKASIQMTTGDLL